MIEEYCEMDDPLVASELTRIDAMLCGEDFLKALGVNARSAPSNAGFSVVTDLVQARTMMFDYWPYDLTDTEPNPPFSDVITDEEARMEGCCGLYESRRVDLAYAVSAFSPELVSLVYRHVMRVFEKHQIRKNLLRAGGGGQMRHTSLTSFTDELLPHYVSSLVYHLNRAVCLVGLDNSPINMRVLEAFETGGMPCGWIGPLPEDGGDPVDAIAVLHFGQKAPSSSS